ncbi:hypothetical protein [Deinococcus soli (ex Cha et al. 2016)]|uniref:hypothetical protein n=1 Tax=Deinococcus soli (ex Cha et al. 2016) TaxID=1309411 RepID=UPI00166CFB27|nr:hypothetical protein [Deinococcus soli (ex Cha et al. 2016)]
MTNPQPAAPAATLHDLRQALYRHAERSVECGLEALHLADAIDQVNPPASAIPRILERLPELARAAGQPLLLRGHLHALA